MSTKNRTTNPGVSVQVTVLHASGKFYAEKANVKLVREKEEFNLVQGERYPHYGGNVPPGEYVLEVTASGLNAPPKTIQVGNKPYTTCAYLGKKGWPCYRLGENIIPFTPPNDLLAVAFPAGGKADVKRMTAQSDDLAKKLPLKPYDPSTTGPKKAGSRKSTERGHIKAGGAVWLFQITEKDTPELRKRLSGQIKEIAGKEARVGVPVDLEENQVKVMDNRFVVRFRESVSIQDRDLIFEQVGARVVRSFRQAKNACLIELPSEDFNQNLQIIEDWFQKGLLVYGEPDIMAELTDDAFPQDAPNDPTYTNQANLTLQQVDWAWRILNNINPDLTTGSPSVYVASLDRGIDLDHPDIGGNLTDGSPQIARCFDFSGMRECTVPGYTPDTDHGMGVYGIIAALADNNEDIAGIAPNTHQIGMERPSLTSADYPDVLLWAAGFTTGNGDPDWPAEPLPNGAAIISCSHGSNGLALSGIMDDTLQDLANNGRGGLGTVVIYSAGNSNTLITGFRTWAAHPNTLAIANSAQPDGGGVERKVGTSNFGPEIDVCAQGAGAPSLNASGGEQNFGGTSAAAPTVAGIAALILSNEPGLTWAQVRDRLRNTAEIIDAANADPVGQWVGGFSQWYGFGRVNAAFAVCGGQPDVTLDTPSINFNDIPEGETTMRAAVFTVESCLPVTLSIVSGPGGDFSTPLGTTVSLDLTSDNSPREARLWVAYTGTTAGSTDSDSITVRWEETGEEWPIPINANTVTRPTAAVMLVLDQSNSMSFNSGIDPTTTRGDVLKFSAPPLVDVLEDQNAIGIIQFDHDPHDIMAIEVAAPLGRPLANGHIASYVHNPNGWTSIGEAVQRAHDLLDMETGYEVKAMIVLTDGREHHGPHTRNYIADVASLINEQVFAIGLGTPENLQPAALQDLCDGNDGYLLMTGDLDLDAYFRLSKYYQQILAGVENKDVVLDPEGALKPGQTIKIPFKLTETDISCDVILLSPAPYVFDFMLETPHGDLIDPGIAVANPTMEYKVGSDVAFYRYSLPTVIKGVDVREGKWHAILCINEKYFRKYLSSLEQNTAEYERLLGQGLRYSLNVHTYSNLRLRARVVQDSNEPGANLQIRALLTEYGIPVENRATAQAHLTRPDGTKVVLSMHESEPGVFTANTTAVQSGVYHFLVKAKGKTLRNLPFTREQIVTASVWRKGNDRPPSSQDNPENERRCWCEFVKCLLSEKAFGNYLKERGIEPEVIHKCLEVYCSECNPTFRPRPIPGLQDFSVLMNDQRFQSILENAYRNYLNQ